MCRARPRSLMPDSRWISGPSDGLLACSSFEHQSIVVVYPFGECSSWGAPAATQSSIGRKILREHCLLSLCLTADWDIFFAVWLWPPCQTVQDPSPSTSRSSLSADSYATSLWCARCSGRGPLPFLWTTCQAAHVLPAASSCDSCERPWTPSCEVPHSYASLAT